MVRLALVIFNFRKNQLFEGTRLMNDGRSGLTRRCVVLTAARTHSSCAEEYIHTLDELTARRRSSRPSAVLIEELVVAIEAAVSGFT